MESNAQHKFSHESVINRDWHLKILVLKNFTDKRQAVWGLLTALDFTYISYKQGYVNTEKYDKKIFKKSYVSQQLDIS